MPQETHRDHRDHTGTIESLLYEAYLLAVKGRRRDLKHGAGTAWLQEVERIAGTAGAMAMELLDAMPVAD